MSDEPKTVSELASMGGKAAAKKMTRTERSERAKLAANARWQKPGKRNAVPNAICGSPDRPLRIANIEIPCYVLDDGRRVIVQRGVLAALAIGRGTGRKGEGDRLTKFVTGKTLNPYIPSELLAVIAEPIRFKIPSNGAEAFGYEATILSDLCNAVVQADHEKKLQPQQRHIATQCVVLIRAFTKLGIVALVDEATGYQEIRAHDALAQILEAFIAKELQPYIRTFEPDYYTAICTLKGWKYKTSSQRPRALAQITNDIVYSRLAPGVLDELREKNPVVKDGRRGAKHFQWLTDNRGHPDLRAHLQRITGWMEMSETWEEFYRVLNDRKPPYRSPRNRGPGLFDDLTDELEEEVTTSSSTEPLPPSEQSPTSAQE